MQVSEQEMQVLLRCCIGRCDDYAVQRVDGSYVRVWQPLSFEVLRLHLAGSQTIGSYVIDEWGRCRFGLFDADRVDGLLQLVEVQCHLAEAGIAAYLEGSRRGAHLWVFLARLASPREVRRWLLPFCPVGVEFYPKQDTASREHPGSLVRVPFGVHRRAGRRYPFVRWEGEYLVPTAPTIARALAWLDTVERAMVPVSVHAHTSDQVPGPDQHKMLSKKPLGVLPVPTTATIYDWCQGQDPVQVIGRYVALDARGMGCCPFGEHHDDGTDSRPSFRVRQPLPGRTNCWYCYVWQRGGDVFEFLRLWYGLSARELWQRVLVGEMF